MRMLDITFLKIAGKQQGGRTTQAESIRHTIPQVDVLVVGSPTT